MLTWQIQHRHMSLLPMFPSGMIRVVFMSILWDAAIFEQPAVPAPNAPTSLTRLKFGESWKLWDKKGIDFSWTSHDLCFAVSAGYFSWAFNLWPSNPLLLLERQISIPSGSCSIQYIRSTEWVMLQIATHTTGIPCHVSFADTNEILDMRQTSFT